MKKKIFRFIARAPTEEALQIKSLNLWRFNGFRTHKNAARSPKLNSRYNHSPALYFECNWVLIDVTVGRFSMNILSAIFNYVKFDIKKFFYNNFVAVFFGRSENIFKGVQLEELCQWKWLEISIAVRSSWWEDLNAA